MKIERVLVDGIELLDICECKIDRSVNEHGYATIKGHIADANEESYFRKSLVDEWAQIIGVSDSGEDINVFGGYIKELAITQIGGQKAVELFLVSGSFLMDLKRNNQTYQDETETYEKIIKDIAAHYHNGYTVTCEEASEAIGKMVAQYEETDWEFVKRMAGNINTVIIPLVRKEKVYFDFGLCGHGKENEIVDILEASYKKNCNGYSYILKTREFLELGEKVKYKNELLYVYKVESNYEGQELVNIYELRRREGFYKDKYYNNRIIGASMEAEVINISADQVQIQVMSETADKVKWFPYATIYSSPDGTGWYCMPEIGDRVRLYYPTNIECEAYVISSTHMPVDTSTDRSNPDYKSIKNKAGKEILFTPEKILITNNNGMSIEINDANGISIVSDKKISIESQEEVNMISLNKGLSIVANEQIYLKQNEAYVDIKNDITFSGGRVKTV